MLSWNILVLSIILERETIILQAICNLYPLLNHYLNHYLNLIVETRRNKQREVCLMYKKRTTDKEEDEDDLIDIIIIR